MKKILVVDDSKIIREKFVEYLKSSGYEAITAKDGKEAVEKIQNEAFDLILMDLMMPVMDGFEAIRRIREIKSLPFIPIIVISGLETPDELKKALELGANEYVFKPIDEMAFNARVQAMLHLKDFYEKVKTSEQKHETLLQSLPDVVYQLDMKGNFVFVSDSVKSLGFKPQELIGRHFSDIVHPDDVLFISRSMVLPKYAGKATGEKSAPKLFDERRSKNRATKNLEIRLIPKYPGVEKDDSPVLNVMVTAAFGEEVSVGQYDSQSEKTCGTVGIIRNITGLKKTERENVSLVMAIEWISEAIVVTDTGGIIQFTNPAFERNAGYSFEEAFGKTPRIVKSGKHGNVYYQKMWETITHGDVWRGHFVNKRKDGTLYKVDAIISPIFDSKGEIFNYVEIARDVTLEVRSKETIAKQLKDMERYSGALLSIMEDMDEKNKDLKLAHLELKQKQAALVQSGKLAAIGELATGVAHEMNQPLMVIRGRTQIILGHRDKLDEKTLKSLETIEQSTSRMTSIIDHLTTFSRKSRNISFKLNLHDIIDSAFTFVNEQLKKSNIIVKKQYMDGLPSIKGDSNQLEQIFLNLISNSRYALDQHEETLKTSDGNENGKWQKIISVKTGYELKENRVWIEFADTGAGIPDDYLDKIFDPFFTSKEVGKGTGLGLSISYGIIKEHKGEIEAFNNEAGAVFKISFPGATES